MIYCHITNLPTFCYIFITVSWFIVFHGLLIWVVAPNCRQILFFLDVKMSFCHKEDTHKEDMSKDPSKLVWCTFNFAPWFWNNERKENYTIFLKVYWISISVCQTTFIRIRMKDISLFPTYSKLFWLRCFLRNVLLGWS